MWTPYYAIKSNVYKDNNCVFNFKKNTYELRKIVDGKINWIDNQTLISEEKLSDLKKSYNMFISSRANTLGLNYSKLKHTNHQWLNIALCNARSLRKNIDLITQY